MPSLFKAGIVAFLFEACTVLGATLAAPTITLDAGTFTGTAGTNTQSFLGIPFAQPPVGDLRFRLPVAVSPYTGTHSATAMGPGCPQQAVKLPILTGLPQEVTDNVVNSIFGTVFPSSEDCLTINVIKPPRRRPLRNYPWLRYWIFGGGFQVGSPQMYDGTTIVRRSIELGEPVIYVSMNYRVSGSTGGGVGNLGLQDQRQAFRWIQKYITAFGGDPTKVTIWGESAGAISVSLHMLANGGNTEGLFRAGFMQSGSPMPVGPTGCSGASDTLECLRTVPFATLKAAQDNTPFIFAYQVYQSRSLVVLAWLPRTDGTFLSDNPQRLVQQGKVAKIPFVTGDCDDEGTMFSLSTLNITEFWVPEATTAEGVSLNTLYPSDQIDGSPFNTGFLNAVTPQFKRIAAFQGDAIFQAPRRFFQQSLSGKQNQWAFLSKREKAIFLLGSTVPNWPSLTRPRTPNLLTFFDGVFPTTITQEPYRAAGMQFPQQPSRFTADWNQFKGTREDGAGPF
ncbi:carotenoid ester lipase precursor [Mycena olivaceomarginata]|nr:carotenoid ester lipase precursor [Mycena olivaceomarginata]